MVALQDIFSQTSDAIFAIDGMHRIVYQNKKFTDIFPSQILNLPHRKCYEVLCGRTLDGKKFCNPGCPVGKSLVKGQAVGNFDLAVPQDNGESLWLSVGAIPASRTFDKAAAIFMLRPLGVFRTLTHPADDKQRINSKPHDVEHRLTRRERQILNLLAQGLATRILADTLHISYVTARNHIQHIYQKLQVHNRAEAVSCVYPRILPR
jgi:DNA-binding CsgD family transcriptional regulator